MSADTQKLQKVMADKGIGSRRQSEQWIKDGRVKVNGQLAHLGQRVKQNAKIELDGKAIKVEKSTELKVWLYNKPLGVICTRVDDEGRPTIYKELKHHIQERFIPVGRLDINSSGLILITNDGEIANRLMHPRYEFERVYRARVLGQLTPEIQKTLLKGVEIEGEKYRFDKIQSMGPKDGINQWLECSLREGKNREVRKLLDSQGLAVNRLIRIQYGPVALPRRLEEGKVELLEPKMMEKLKKILEKDS